MTDASQDRAIGRIEGKVDLILKDQQDARDARKQQYERLESIERRAAATETKVGGIDRRLDKIETGPVADMGRWKERWIGAVMVLSFLSAVFGAVLTAAWKWILAKLGA